MVKSLSPTLAKPSRTKAIPARRSTDRSSIRAVAIGGGTGLSTLLRGLREYVASPHPSSIECAPAPCLISDLAAVVTVTDDGGSSGRLRRGFNMLPPGDLRNCMVALSEDEHLISRLFRHRFTAGEGLEGHSFGNLFVAALLEMTGDFAQAIKLSSQVLATRGHIYPVTNANVSLAARMDDGSLVHGETNITASRQRIVELMLDPADAEPLPETLEAIELADLITVGPGSLFTSIITNLLVKGVSEALASSRAVRVYICNLMTQANESLNLTASQHIERIYEHAHQRHLRLRLGEYRAGLKGSARSLRRRRGVADRRRHRGYRSPWRALYRRRLCRRRRCSPPRCRSGSRCGRAPGHHWPPIRETAGPSTALPSVGMTISFENRWFRTMVPVL